MDSTPTEDAITLTMDPLSAPRVVVRVPAAVSLAPFEGEDVRAFDAELDRDTEEWSTLVRPAAVPGGVGARGAVVVAVRGVRAHRVK